MVQSFSCQTADYTMWDRTSERTGFADSMNVLILFFIICASLNKTNGETTTLTHYTLTVLHSADTSRPSLSLGAVLGSFCLPPFWIRLCAWDRLQHSITNWWLVQHPTVFPAINCNSLVFLLNVVKVMVFFKSFPLLGVLIKLLNKIRCIIWTECVKILVIAACLFNICRF